MSDTSYRIIDNFSDPAIDNQKWNKLLEQSSTDVVFLTKQWLQTWWEVYGRGKLLIVVAENNNDPIAIAPLFADSGMIYFVGSGGSDYLDFIGNIESVELLEGLLNTGASKVGNFLGFLFYHIPERSSSIPLLKKLASSKQWKLYDEGSIEAPFLDITWKPEWSESLLRKKSIRRNENYFLRNGGIEVFHYESKKDILNLLDYFFEQHIARWEKTEHPSLFLDEQNKKFFRTLSEITDNVDWIIFTAIKWKEKYIAYHYGFKYKKSFLWYKPTFDITLRKHSPGEVLLSNLLKASFSRKDLYFDFGLGEEHFKYRFSNKTNKVKNWGLYPANMNL